ncbi:dTDP-4-dehydrorhamnose reductase [bacterium 336/3]|nr:dTDP-4-dehydrorhamnose reductase [bacterium 336/3]
MNSPETILITGSNGLLGQKLVHLLSEQDIYSWVATARGTNRIDSSKPFQFASMDTTNPAQINEIFELYKPTIVIHTAAMTQVDDCEKDHEACTLQNVTTVKYLADACVNHKAFFIHLSTDFIFDGEAGPYDEEAQANPLSFYGHSKLKAEEIIKNTPDLDWAIARTVLVYGIAQDMSRSNIILWVKKSLEDGKNIKVVDDQWRSPTLAEDLAMGCFLIAKHKAKGIFNISGKDLLTPYQMALKTADFFGLDKNLIEKADSTTFTQPAKRPPKTGFIIDKAKNVLGYNPCSFEEGIAILANQLLLIAQ